MDIRDIFRQRLKERRLANLMTQEELAEKVGIQSSLVSRYESGKRIPKIDTLEKICQALNCSSDYLLGLSDEIKKMNEVET